MNQQPEQPFTRFLQQVRAALRDLPPEQQQAIEAELQAHLHDAAHDMQRDPADPGVQLAVVRALGSPRRLGRALAQTHRPARIMPAHRLWIAWIGAGIVGWGLTIVLLIQLFTRSPDHAGFVLMLGGAITSGLHALLLRRAVPGFHAGPLQMTLFCGGWLIGALVLLLSPLDRLWEPIVESLIIVVLPLAVGLLVGVLQQAALRSSLGPNPFWPAASGIDLLVGLVGTLGLGNIIWATGRTNWWGGAALIIAFSGGYSAITGAVLWQMRVQVRQHSLAGGGRAALDLTPHRPSGPWGHAATALAALPIALICGSLLTTTPLIHAGTTTVMSATNVAVSHLESGRTGITWPGSAATLYVHEDHRHLLQFNALNATPPDQPISLRIYARDVPRLDQPGRIRALEIRSADQVYLPLEAVAFGRNAAEPLLVACMLGALAALGYSGWAGMRQLRTQGD